MDYYEISFKGVTSWNRKDYKNILKLLSSDLLPCEQIVTILDRLNVYIEIMELDNIIPNDCPKWLYQKYCRCKKKKYEKQTGKDGIIYE